MKETTDPVTGVAGRKNVRLGLWMVATIIFATVTSALVGMAALAAEDNEAQGQVVGGGAVSNGKYPFMVSLQNDRAGTSPREDHFCGATLVSSRYVMTAAHCARPMKDGTFEIRRLRVVVGRTVLNSRQGVVRRIAGRSAIRIHPNYSGRRSVYDVAVIRLDKPVGRIKPIQLDRLGSNALERPKSRATVAGWGLKREPNFLSSGSTVNRMRAAHPPIVSDKVCSSNYAKLRDPKFRVYPRLMVCAGKKNVDTCQGDSGGPLLAATRGGFRQIGVTSFGNGCGRAGYPGVYTELSAPAIGKFVRRVSGTT